MAWRVAKSLEVLRKQIDVLAPSRSKASDGGIGDAVHASRSSDHNPHIKDGNIGVVTARDFTHDPRNGLDAGKIARLIAATKDERIKYLISNGEICSGPAGPQPWVWRKYSGSNPHTKHFHLSVNGTKKHYDNERPWVLLGGSFAPVKDAVALIVRPVLRRGSKGEEVRRLQLLLTGLKADGDFGPKTETAVKDFQRRSGIEADGIVGPYTWDALG